MKMGLKSLAHKDKEYEVDRIVGYCADTDKYRVRWKGYLEDEDTWEPFQHLNEAAQIEAIAFKQTWEDNQLIELEQAKGVCDAGSTKDKCASERREPKADEPESDELKAGEPEADEPEADSSNHEEEKPNSDVPKSTFSDSSIMTSYAGCTYAANDYPTWFLGDIPGNSDMSVVGILDDISVFDNFSSCSYDSIESLWSNYDTEGSEINPKAPPIREISFPVVSVREAKYPPDSFSWLNEAIDKEYKQHLEKFPIEADYNPSMKESAIKIVDEGVISHV